MAEIKRASTNSTRVYATDELGIRADALKFAQENDKQLQYFYAESLGIDISELTKENLEYIAKTSINSKVKMITNSRTNRDTRYDN